MKTDIMVHCGNAPKMERAIDLAIAFAKKDFDTVKIHVREDFVWSIVGSGEVIHYDKLIGELPLQPEIDTLTVDNALSHGNGAMCEGTLLFVDGTTLSFCMVVEFVNTAKDALVKSAHTYFVK